MPPDHGLSDKKCSGVKGNKVCLTFALTSNADGSVKKEAFIIGIAQKPRAFGGRSGGQLGFYYRNNAKAWMTGALYGEWIKNWDDELRREGCKILLLQDNCTGHIVICAGGLDEYLCRKFLCKFDTSCAADGCWHHPMLQGTLSRTIYSAFH